MIRFFRKLRQKLLAEGKLGQYLTYAVGEILLVVIGILIALALNNWNSDRKERDLEIKLLEEIHEDLRASLYDLESGLEVIRESQDMTRALRDHIMNRESENELTTKYMLRLGADDQYFPRVSGYTALQSAGFQVLSNDSLRQDITFVYELINPRIVGLGREHRSVRFLEMAKPYQDKYLILSDSVYYRVHRDRQDSTRMHYHQIVHYDELLDDEQFKKELQYIIGSRGHKVFNYLWAIDDTKELMAAIENEIERLKAKR
ncbi:hypothetical protein HZ996_05770 [Cryomorphaceae bacterium]|nr:hypothetical protein HZ996_05770 [Cryomorphaceae bacterium]